MKDETSMLLLQRLNNRQGIFSFITFFRYSLAIGLFFSFGLVNSTLVSAQSWSALSSGTNNAVYSFATYNGDLYASGIFNTAGGSPAVGVARWNGSGWSAVGTGVAGSFALAVYNGELYAGGGGQAVVSKWNGTAWSQAGIGISNTVFTMTTYNSELYAAGEVTSLTGNALVKWDGTNWNGLGTVMCICNWPEIRALAVYNGELYAGGEFTTAGGVVTDYIAKWNGTSWASVGTGVGTSQPSVSALAVYNGELYAAGQFSVAGGTAVNNIAKWNGSSWSVVGNGITGASATINAMQVFNGELYAAGDFDYAGTHQVENIAKWDGTSWSPIGQGINGVVNTLAVHDGELYAGGVFTMAGGVAASNVAKFTPCSAAPPQPGTITGNTVTCTGSTYTYSVAPVAGAYTYTWSLPAGWTGGSTTNTITVTPSATSGSITVAGINSCGTGTMKTLAVTGNQPPVANITPNSPTSFCTGGSVTLYANTGAGYSYQWKHGINNIAGATNSTYTATTSGIYSVLVTSGSCSLHSNLITVNSNPLPTPFITQSGNLLVAPNGYASYQWYKDAIMLAGATNATYFATQQGSYYVEVVDTNGCQGQSQTMFPTLSTVDVAHESSYGVFPNPNNGTFSIRGSRNYSGTEEFLEVTDVTGKRLYKDRRLKSDRDMDWSLNLSHLPPGTYIIRLISGQEISILRFTRN